MIIYFKPAVFFALIIGIYTLSLPLFSARLMAKESPCGGSLKYLDTQYELDPVTRKAFDLVYAGLIDLPAGYSYKGSRQNPWKVAGNGKDMYLMMVNMFETWCTDLPESRAPSRRGS